MDIEPNKADTIYRQHDAAFARVSAFVITDQSGERVATVAIKFPADGAGRLYAYTHFLGLPMTRGSASGYGYDKRSPAVIGGFQKSRDALAAEIKADAAPLSDHRIGQCAAVGAFLEALGKDDGEYWDAKLRRAGYNVMQAV